MNKQELIKKYKRLEGVWDAPGAETARQIFLQDLEQLDEPEKVTIPQFVADWYEKNKDEFELNLWVFLTDFDEENIDMSERFGIWLGDEDNNPIQTLVNMHQFGYEVEREKRYLVKVKGIVNALSFLSYHKNADIWTVTDKNNSDGHRAHHTRKQLEEAGFGEVFNSPLFEVEEV